MTLDAVNLERLRASGVRIVSQFDVPEGALSGACVAVTSGTENGSVVYDVEVPDFTADPLALSGVALTSLTPDGAATLRPGTIKRTKLKSKQCRAAVCESSAAMESTLAAWSTDGQTAGAHMLQDVTSCNRRRLPVSSRLNDTLALYAEVYGQQSRRGQGRAVRNQADRHPARSERCRRA
jgi:hypothetical protein